MNIYVVKSIFYLNETCGTCCLEKKNRKRTRVGTVTSLNSLIQLWSFGDAEVCCGERSAERIHKGLDIFSISEKIQIWKNRRRGSEERESSSHLSFDEARQSDKTESPFEL